MQQSSDDTTLCELDHYGYIAVVGEDAVAFLQGQLTADVRQLLEPVSVLAGYCNAQGRLLACMRLFYSSERYVLRLPRELVTPVLRRLQLFVLRSKVTLSDISDQQHGLGLCGADSPALLAQQFTEWPADSGQLTRTPEYCIVRVPGESPRFELYGSSSALHTLQERLRPAVSVVDSTVWRHADILAGLPEIYQATQDRFIPQMLNLDLLGGIAFDKGCYVGQEIVARTHYLGRLKRRMARLYSEQAPLLEVSDLLSIVGDTDGQAAVQVVQVAAVPAGGVELLVVLPINSLSAESLNLQHDAHRFSAKILPLPYSVPPVRDDSAPASHVQTQTITIDGQDSQSGENGLPNGGG